MKIELTSVFVSDQDKALAFYTDILGFVKKTDLPAGEFKWLTVVSPDTPDGVELLLEPNDNAAAKVYQAALHEQNIPATAFRVDDIHAEYERLRALGVSFITAPTPAGPSVMAIFDDTVGNYIQLYQV